MSLTRKKRHLSTVNLFKKIGLKNKYFGGNIIHPMFKNENNYFCCSSDDEVLGCGGFIAKYSSDNKFKVVFIAEGETCRMKKMKH